jgi:GTPase SAR1 family protein
VALSRTRAKKRTVHTSRDSSSQARRATAPVKILICGDVGSGKSTFLQEFRNSNKVSRVVTNAGCNFFLLDAVITDRGKEYSAECEIYEVNDIGALATLPEGLDLGYLVFDLSANRGLEFSLQKWIVQL